MSHAWISAMAALAVVVPASSTADTGKDWSSLKLWYRQPAPVSDAPPRPFRNDPGWLQALPIGNGRLGAMVFGGISKERIQLNDNTLWDGHKQDTTNPEALKHLPDVRRLLFEGKNKEATELADRYLMGNPKGVKSYQTLGDLWIETGHKERGIHDYRRELDLDTGLVTVSYKIGDAVVTRKTFAVRNPSAIVTRIHCSEPMRLPWLISASRSDATWNRDKRAIILRGRAGSDGVRFAAAVEVRSDGYETWHGSGSRLIDRATEIEVAVLCETDFGSPGTEMERLSAASAKFERASPIDLTATIEEHRKLFRRVWLGLGGGLTSRADPSRFYGWRQVISNC